MGNTTSRGVGRALAQERLRAEIGVKLHMAIGDRAGHRAVMEKAFRGADVDGDGTITFAEFAKAAASINLGVSEPELRTAFDRFDVNCDSTIEFEEIIDFMCPRVVTHGDRQAHVAVQHLERLAQDRKALEVGATSDVPVAVRKVAQVVYNREMNVRRAFQTWDGNGSGDLDISEFTSALNSLGFSLDLVDAKHIFAAFDIDGDGRIKCWEFVRTLGQFDAELQGGVLPPTHNAGRGGGGDAIGGGGSESRGDVIGAPGGNSLQSTRSKMADKSRSQNEAKAKIAEDARKQAEEALAREQELQAALAAVEAKRKQLDQANAAMQNDQRAAFADAERAYREAQRQLQGQREADEAGLREQMAVQQQQMELLRAQDAAAREAAEATKNAGLLGWITGGGNRSGEDSRDAEKRRLAEQMEGSGAGSVSDVLETGLKRFDKPRSQTDTYQKGVYAWQHSVLDPQVSDEALFKAIAARLKYVHTTPQEALAQVVGEPNLAKNINAFGEHGVDAPVFAALAASVLFNLDESRARTALYNACDRTPKAPILSVPKFLSLFGASAFASKRSDEPTLADKFKGRGPIESLSSREQKLMLTMRDYLFEQHSKMASMFKRCDPDGSGHVTIEEFLNAMSRAGVPVGHGLDRAADNTISEEEAANIVGFFDRDGDGHLRYAEFMNMLQGTKNSVLTTKVLSQRGHIERPGREIH